MKNYDISLYRKHVGEIVKCEDPYNIECYMRGVLDIALNPKNFNTEEQASGILDKNDIIQECYVALVNAWGNIDWDAIRGSDEPQAKIWAYLKKTIKLDARNAIHDKKDGIRIPHGKRWELNETKDVDDFLSQLFPPDFFSENAEAMGLYEEQITRYDIEQLGIGLDNVMEKHLSSKEKLVLEYYFGVDRPQKSYKYIAKMLNTTESNVRKIKQRGLEALDCQEVKDYLQTFYHF